MELNPYQWVGAGAAAVVVLGWLVVSFSPPSRARARVEWLAATGIYVGLLSLFVYLAGNAWRSGSSFALVAFGFLCVFFGCGLAVSLWSTLRSFGGERKEQGSTTN